jgi:hypothetical protein
MILFSIVQKINEQNEIVKLNSNYDNRKYVVRKLPDAQLACEKLALINYKVDLLFKQIKQSNHKEEGYERLFERYNPDKLSETLPGSKYTSYSVNKGEQISLCIRQPDDTFIDTNIVVFVIVHELAHIMTKEVGHTKTFWKNMKYLLEQCEIAKVYHPDNYNENPVPYCGMKITTTPYDFKK